MEHQYMNRKIEVHTEQVGKRWDWWFVIDDPPAQTQRRRIRADRGVGHHGSAECRPAGD